jgi:hypothetical protein
MRPHFLFPFPPLRGRCARFNGSELPDEYVVLGTAPPVSPFRSRQ